MSYFSDILPKLRQAAYLRCHFRLEFLRPVTLPQGALLQLRREFLTALKELKEQGGDALSSRIEPLFLPPLPAAQLLRTLVKSPPPGVVLSFDCLQAHTFQPGDSLVLTSLFIGDTITKAADFLTLLRFLGARGIYCGSGHYTVSHVQVENANGEAVDLSAEESDELLMHSPVCDFKWWLDNLAQQEEQFTIEIFSPLRLQKGGKPVFRPDVAIFVDALTRRISSLLAYYCHIDIDHGQWELDAMLSKIGLSANTLRWQDWRQLQGEGKQQKIGGVLGRLELLNCGSLDLFYLLNLGQFFNLGKSAAFGSGQYRLLSP
jgi:hypothetical protein